MFNVWFITLKFFATSSLKDVDCPLLSFLHCRQRTITEKEIREQKKKFHKHIHHGMQRKKVRQGNQKKLWEMKHTYIHRESEIETETERDTQTDTESN